MNPTASLAPIAAALLVTGVHASDTDPRGAPVWQVAIAHDFRCLLYTSDAADE